MNDKPKKPKAGGPAKGAGWGGPARGAHPDKPKHPDFVAGNKHAVGYHDMSRDQRLKALDERKWRIAMGEVEVQAVALAALNSYEDRHVGKPKQALTIAGDEGGPPVRNEIIITYRKPGSDVLGD